MNRIFKKAKSLCAVLLSCAVVFASAPKILSADEPSSSVDPDTNETYVYSITIEFGSFDFYYDYGVWDSASLQYKANEASKNPAKDTQNTFPGWYGFDGTANKITIENSSSNGDVKVKLEYTDVPLANDTTDNVSFPLKPGTVTMTCYDDAAFTTMSPGAITNGCSFTMAGLDSSATPTSKEIYLSFSGRPVNTDGTNFISAQAQRIGYITLTISLPDADA
jgi:hypothetical protein